MKSVPIFYLHCTCYKFRIAVLIFERINVIRAKSLVDISRRRVSLLDENNINLFGEICLSKHFSMFPVHRWCVFLTWNKHQIIRARYHIVSYGTFALFFQCAKIVTEPCELYLINLLSKRWCQKSLSRTMQHVGLLLIGFSLPRVR